MFAEGQLTLGIFFAIEAYSGSVPSMKGQVELAQRAEALGFSALWVRDVPLHDPDFGDAGQIFDPWVYLGFITARTQRIALATGSIIFPLRHPLHLAKAAASVAELSGGRLVLGVASGDRPVEFPAFGKVLTERGEAFRETLDYFQRVLKEPFPRIDSPLGTLDGSADLLPKPASGRIPVLVTGNSQQPVEWIAQNADGWVMYPRPPGLQRQIVREWRQATEADGAGRFKPFAQSLYIDLVEDASASPVPIHLGYRLGRHALRELLHTLQQIGVNHVAFNLKYGRRPAAEVLEELGQEIVPHFPARG
jgi:luciferase-type oxidoreductase